MKRLTLRIPDWIYADLKRNAKMMEQSINRTAIEALYQGQKWQLKKIKAQFEVYENDPKLQEMIEVAKTKWIDF